MSHDKVPQLDSVMSSNPSHQPPSAPCYSGSEQPPPYYPPGHQSLPPPIQQQPSSHMGYEEPNSLVQGNLYNCLANASSFYIKQEVEPVEVIGGLEKRNKYIVKDQVGNKVFYVSEQSDTCARQCFGSDRPFNLAFKDAAENNIMNMDRPYNSSFCSGRYFPDRISVSTANGQLLGSVTEEISFFYPKFNLNDATGRKVLSIKGPSCPLLGSCCGPVVFKVLNHNGTAAGTIIKERSGPMREHSTDADYFSMSFPQDLDPATKAVCLAALFLIDYHCFVVGCS